MTKTSNKRKGNSEENKCAKILGEWIFDDRDALQRHLTSGAQKDVFIGDIVPQKRLRWKNFILNIEVKKGYPNDIPDFFSHSKLVGWFKKAWEQSQESEYQKIVLLICQFHNKKRKLVMTNYCAKKCVPALVIPVRDIGIYSYIYYLNDLLKHNFEEIFEVEDYDI